MKSGKKNQCIGPTAGLRVIAGLAVGVSALGVPMAAWGQQPENVVINGVPQPGMPQPGHQPGQPGGEGQPGAQPGAQPAGGAGGTGAAATSKDLPNIDVGDDEVLLSVLSEPLEMTALVDLVARTLNINVTVDAGLTGQVAFNAPVRVKKDRLLKLLEAMLEDKDFAITFDPQSGFYRVSPSNKIPPRVLDKEDPESIATTRVISTPNVRPTALKGAIEAQFGSGGSGAAQPGGAPPMPMVPGQGASVAGAIPQVAYIDELGVIVATGTQRKLDAIENLVKLLLTEYNRTEFIRFELKYVAASVARERAIQLIGQAPQQQQQQQNRNPFNPFGGGGDGQNQAQQRPATLDNLADRLTIDPQGNALFFRGLQVEIDRVKEVMKLIDVGTALASREYYAGGAAKQIADIAKSRGLGEVIVVNDRNDQNRNRPWWDQQPQQQQQTVIAGGPVMVVDDTRGSILYYATTEQQGSLQLLIDTLQLSDDVYVVQVYKLQHANAEETAELILGLLENRTPAGEGDTLPTGTGDNNTNQPIFFDPFGNQQQSDSTSLPGFSKDENTFVLADQKNNQILVKAKAKLQPAFEQLIQRLDLRRAQVFLECKIVAVTASDDFRLAFETQLINAGGTGGVVNTDFDLSTFGAGDSINGTKTVATNLGGLTAAVIKSDQVPIIINALQTVTDTKIISTPTLMVDDNEEATLESVNQQPTTTTNQGNATTSTTFGGYEDAGTTLTITPQVSEGGYVKLKYEAKLSNFDGRTQNGIPPPKNNNTVTAESVSVPSDMTVVTGGLTVSSDRDSVIKVPLLGDIPLIGLLFRDTQKITQSTTLYIFLTPRVVRDPSFGDMKLLTEGPAKQVELDLDLPEMEPATVRVYETYVPRAVIPAQGPFDPNTLKDLPEPDPEKEPDSKSPWNGILPGFEGDAKKN